MKSRQLSNIPTHGFLSKCKNNLILPTDQSKSPKNDKSIELELYRNEDLSEEHFNTFLNVCILQQSLTISDAPLVYVWDKRHIYLYTLVVLVKLVSMFNGIGFLYL